MSDGSELRDESRRAATVFNMLARTNIQGHFVTHCFFCFLVENLEFDVKLGIRDNKYVMCTLEVLK